MAPDHKQEIQEKKNALLSPMETESQEFNHQSVHRRFCFKECADICVQECFMRFTQNLLQSLKHKVQK